MELRLTVESRIVEGLDNEYGDVVWIEVDGDRLGPINGREYIGQAPVELLASTAFVAPDEQPREVILGRCTCGEPGCGRVTARVYALDSDTIAWDLLQAGNPPPPDLRRARPLPGALLFDRRQYLAAVANLSGA